MKLEEFLISIKDVAQQNGLSEAYIVGGVPRDRIIGRIGDKSEIKDIDITTGNSDSKKLGMLIMQKYPEGQYRQYSDGHSSIDIFGIHIDLSSNFVIPGIEEELAKLSIPPTDMNKEIFSRDFCINTILETLDFSNTFDLTKQGIGDIHAGFVRCPINPIITIGVDSRRILRAIKFAVKFGFVIEHNLKMAMMEHRKLLTYLPPRYVSEKIDEIVQLDPDKGIDMLIEFKILPLVQLSKTTYDILIQRRKLIRAL